MTIFQGTTGRAAYAVASRTAEGFLMDDDRVRKVATI